MPELGFGTWRVGGAMTKDITLDLENIRGLKIALDMGLTHIDTAEIYAAGHSEELIGRAISGRDRSRLLIVSKVWSGHLKYKDVLKACEESLRRLSTDYLDVYLIHAPNSEIPMQDTMRALDQLKREGKIREIGVSNFDVQQLKEAQNSTENKIVTNQIHYNLAYREWQDVVNYCQTNDILVTAYRPIERGILVSKNIKIISELSKKYGKTPSQISLNWLISQKNVIAICKMVSREHIKENLGALGWELEQDDVLKLKSEFPHIQVG